MAQVLTTLITKVVTGIGFSQATAASVAAALTSKTAFAIATLAVSSLMQRAALKKAQSEADLKRDVVVRSATEARKIVYGETVVGGVLVYSNVTGAYNANLFMVVAHAGHECSAITDIHLDDKVVLEADNPFGMTAVTGGEFYTGGVGYAAFARYLGTDSQTAESNMVSQFADWTTDHRGRGICYTVTQLLLNKASEKIFEAGAPSKIRAKIRGKKVYDPALDVGNDGDDMINNGFSSTTYKAYRNNPVLCIIDYLMDDELGMGVDPSRIDWDTVQDEADFCDGNVLDSDGNYMKRYTCNGVLSCYDSHKTNLSRLLSCCNGSMYYKNGKWGVRVGRLGTGPNIITDGQFSSIGAWVTGDAAVGTVVASGGHCVVTNTGGAGFARAVRGYTTEIGKVYTFTAFSKAHSGGGASLIGVSNNSDGSSPFVTSASDNQDNKANAITFTATATTTYAVMRCNVATTSAVAEFDEAEMYLVAEKTITGDWLRDSMAIQTQMRKEEKFNSCKAFYVSPDEDYKQVEMLEVVNTPLVARDGGESIFRELQLPFVDSEDRAQLICFKQINMNSRQKTFSLPCNYLALDVAVGDRIVLDIDELSINQLCVVERWVLNENDGGIDLLLREESAAAHIDPDTNDYSTRTASGGIVLATPDVPAPTSVTLSARSDSPVMTVEWVLPNPPSYWDFVEVWRNTTNNFGTATKVYTGRGSSFIDSTGVTTSTYYYWVRTVKGDEESSEVATSPTNSVVAAIVATTASEVPWTGVTGAAKPEDNATVGGDLGLNLRDEGGAMLTDLRSVNKKILSKSFLGGQNFNPYMDVAREDGTPAGYYIARMTGSGDRDDVMGFEDPDNPEVFHYKSGSRRPLIVCTAAPIVKDHVYFTSFMLKADASTTLNFHCFLLDSETLAAGTVSFASLLSNNETEVGTATRENGAAAGRIQVSISNTTFGTGTLRLGWLYQALDGGTDLSTPYDAKWIVFGFQRESSATDTDIYLEHFVVHSVHRPFLMSGAP